jgi:hypothetical protein
MCSCQVTPEVTVTFVDQQHIQATFSCADVSRRFQVRGQVPYSCTAVAYVSIPVAYVSIPVAYVSIPVAYVSIPVACVSIPVF